MENEQTWNRDDTGSKTGIGFSQSSFSIYINHVFNFRRHFFIHVIHRYLETGIHPLKELKMIYFLHNSQTGRIQQSPSLEQFEGPDRVAFMNILRKQWLNRDVFNGNGSTVYRINHTWREQNGAKAHQYLPSCHGSTGGREGSNFFPATITPHWFSITMYLLLDEILKNDFFQKN